VEKVDCQDDEDFSRKVAKHEIQLYDADADNGVDNMTNLRFLNEASIVQNLHTRFSLRTP
jgi:myosin heavy subunit